MQRPSACPGYLKLLYSIAELAHLKKRHRDRKSVAKQFVASCGRICPQSEGLTKLLTLLGTRAKRAAHGPAAASLALEDGEGHRLLLDELVLRRLQLLLGEVVEGQARHDAPLAARAGDRERVNQACRRLRK